MTDTIATIDQATSSAPRQRPAGLDALMQRGADFLGTRYAIMAGAMSWVSERNLVSAISNAGASG